MNYVPQNVKNAAKHKQSKRVASMNIDGKLKSEFNVVFTGFLFELLKTIMFSPKKQVANWHVHCTNLYFYRRVLYRAIGITAKRHYRDYHRKLRQGLGNYLTSICQTDELLEFALTRVSKIIPTSAFVYQTFRDKSGEIVEGAVKE